MDFQKVSSLKRCKNGVTCYSVVYWWNAQNLHGRSSGCCSIKWRLLRCNKKRYERRFKLDCLIICSFDIQKSSFCESPFVGCSFEWQFNKRSQSLLPLRVNRVNLLQPRPRLWVTTPSRLWRTTPSRLWTTPPSRPNSAGKRWKYFMQCSIGTMLFPSTTTDQMFGQLFVDNLRSR